MLREEVRSPVLSLVWRVSRVTKTRLSDVEAVHDGHAELWIMNRRDMQVKGIEAFVTGTAGSLI